MCYNTFFYTLNTIKIQIINPQDYLANKQLANMTLKGIFPISIFSFKMIHKVSRKKNWDSIPSLLSLHFLSNAWMLDNDNGENVVLRLALQISYLQCRSLLPVLHMIFITATNLRILPYAKNNSQKLQNTFSIHTFQRSLEIWSICRKSNRESPETLALFQVLLLICSLIWGKSFNQCHWLPTPHHNQSCLFRLRVFHGICFSIFSDVFFIVHNTLGAKSDWSSVI